MAGMLHLALLDGGQINLRSNTLKSFGAQRTLTFSEGGLSRMLSQSGAVLHQFTFPLAFIPQSTFSEHLPLHCVVVR